jgi:nondiscriminating glutamyl-tRNA synthetase
MVRVRFAPSPTGFVHVGSLRTALYNELFALRHGGVFVLRIEDTDQTRYVEGAVENLLRSLKWAGIEPTEGAYLADDGTVKERGAFGPYVQSARTELYLKHADELVASGKAYRCFCTAERLEEVRQSQAAAKQPMIYDKHCRGLSRADAAALIAEDKPWVIRLAVPDSGATVFEDAIRDTVKFENALVDDQVLIKSDGFPTYHLANVVDDHAMGITHVIRGEEWLPSTPKHVLLYEAFGWTPPQFAHGQIQAFQAAGRCGCGGLQGQRISAGGTRQFRCTARLEPDR